VVCELVPYQEPEFLPWDGRRVPITFVGGYLGAGKTTIINEVLANADRPIAVIVNDAGAINIDAKLVRRRHGDTIELTNGCICCSSIDEMGAAFDLIRARETPPDHVIVELSGVAEPQRMIPWGESAGFMLDGVVVVVAADQLSGGALPEWVQHHVRQQVDVADLLVLSKTDCVSIEVANRARAALSAIAPQTPVFEGGSAVARPGALGRFLALGGRRPGGLTDLPDPSLFDAHIADTVPFPAGVDRSTLEEWLSGATKRPGHQLVRAKGLVRTTDLGLMLVQIVGKRSELTIVPQPELAEPSDLVRIWLKAD
jgi:G3E family GTPase